MNMALAYYNQQTSRRMPQALDARLNRLALEYGYRYRLDIQAKNDTGRVEFVRTLREARYVGIPVRRLGGLVHFSKINDDGTLARHYW